MSPIQRLPEIEMGPPIAVGDFQAQSQKIGYDEVDLRLDLSAGRENEPRCLMFIADTGLPDHVDIPKPIDAFNFTSDRSVNDGHNHSTWINGKMTAFNNEIGYQGIMPSETPIVILKVLDNNGSGSNMNAAMAKALDYWTSHPKRKSGEWIAAFYGMSYGGGGFDSRTADLFRDMVAQGMIPTGSSGNEGRSHAGFPAGYDAVFACGAYDRNRKKAGFTNYGPWTDFVAPGVDVPSTINRDQYAFWSGTSMSRPITEATLANFLSSRPNDTEIHNFHGLKKAVAPFMKNLPGDWAGDGVFLPATATVRNKYFIF